MLPYTPLHHLLLSELGLPVVATSGNLSDEPICTDEREALQRLGPIAGLFLVHNRPIVRAVDDSVVRVMMGRELVLRRARGYAPLPFVLRSNAAAHPILSVGAHLKNTVALAVGRQDFLSQHLGDLENVLSFEAFLRVQADLQKLFRAQSSPHRRRFTPGLSFHPIRQRSHGKASGPAKRFPRREAGGERGEEGEGGEKRAISVQHHSAHVLACMAENELEPPVLGVAWDGTGYGLDGTIWGGEFLLVNETSIIRRAHFRHFRLPGGDKAIKEPRRIALALLREVFGEDLDADQMPSKMAFSASELATLNNMLDASLNSPLTSSVGRLFDGVAALAGLRQKVSFEGQAAMELEFALNGVETDEAYPCPVSEAGPSGDGPFVLDWQPIIEGVLTDRQRHLPVGEISAKFHNALVEALIAAARRVGEPQVALTGGCFQNRYLTERAVKRLEQEGFRAYWHQRVPPNDGGTVLGQILAAIRAKA